ncbi:UxaA family hydrolase [Vulcanisaeta sp. JCM 16161]|uniref:UxaA family hydrolase n=1 Tax=Vulcanisaeta sp. JCM 16161 TaxID=1295372 RepID=UPI0006D29E36|nr:UxaA family hydrolase [Vulcanisaeta sp. JCM 16161]
MESVIITGAPAIVLNPSDNVAVALRDLRAGEDVELVIGNSRVKVKLLNDIPFGHKFAIRDIRMCDYVIKYGHVIGRAKRDIKAGEHVHVHNVESLTAVHSVCRGGNP